MFFDPNGAGSGLPHSPIKALVAPRPIGWISTLSPDGVANLAPYSFFNLVADSPTQVMFATTGHKDSFYNATARGEFVWNLVTADLTDAMNRSSASVDRSVDEFALAGLTKAPSRTVAPPRVAEAKAAFECVVDQFIPLRSSVPGQLNTLVLGTVNGVYIDDDLITDGLFDTSRAQPLARLGYMDYSTVEKTFTLQRPK